MKICSVCQRCYEDTTAFCYCQDSNWLVAARFKSCQITKNYRLNRLVAQDAITEIYSAFHRELDKPCLINIFAADVLQNRHRLFERLKSEVKIAATVIHPNVASILEYGTLENKDFFVVRESNNHQTLQQYLRDVELLPEESAICLARQIAKSLEAIHNAGLIHRAINPANITIGMDADKKALIKIQNFDFGGIRQQFVTENVFDEQTNLQALKYFSPEQCAGFDANQRSDVYSLAIILYEMLAGQPPFLANLSKAIRAQQLNQSPNPLRHLHNETRSLLMHTLMLALEKKSAARTNSAAEFSKHLRQIQQLTAHSKFILTHLPQPAAPVQTTPFVFEIRKDSGKSDAANSAAPDSLTKVEQSEVEHSNAIPFRLETVVASVKAADKAPSAAQNLKQNYSAEDVKVSQNVRTLKPRKRLLNRVTSVNAAFVMLLTTAILSVALYNLRLQSFTARQEPINSDKNIEQLQPLNETVNSKENAVDKTSSAFIGNSAEISEEIFAANNDKRKTAQPLVNKNLSDIKLTRLVEYGSDNVSDNVRSNSSNNVRSNSSKLVDRIIVDKIYDKEAQTKLNASLSDWIEATNARNVDQQMSYYAPTVNSFYLAKNASHLTVRAEKKRVFDNAQFVDMEAGKPNILISADGRTAKMRFRKKYTIKGGQNRSGEVLQELRWVKSGKDWKIVGERDLKVLVR